MIVVRQCEGNANGDNAIHGTDKSQVAQANGTPADATTAFMDVNLDGSITGTDKAKVSVVGGNACPAP